MEYIVISIFAGGAGGNIGCLLARDCRLGPTLITAAGAVGGGVGGAVLARLLMPGTKTTIMDVGHLGAMIGAGLTAGAACAILLGLLTRPWRK
ncbi:MAG: hypothetical protein KGN33_07110 [Paracoccaceae bacterium]|nr:hypothetical protein [Paracoccaceae bacterium]